jgi:ABC-type Mn2+/Zn2+ transport system permease subunit
MLDALTDPFAQGIAQRALVEVTILGAVCGPLGVWIGLYRRSYAAESIAHAALPGLVIAALAGIPLALGAAGGLLVAALAISLAGRYAPVGGDVAVAVVVTALFGAGALLALSPEVPTRLGALLFGDPLSVSGSDLVASGALAAAVLATLAAFHRTLAVAAFEPASAPSLGASPARAELVVLVALATTTLIAVEALGNLLVVALLIAPGAAALRLAHRLPRAFGLSVAIGVGSGIGGLYISHYLEIAAGASIALVAVAAFALSLAVARTGYGASGGGGGTAVDAVASPG